MQHQGYKEWAFRLQDKEAAGIPLSKLQQQYWREALGKRKDEPAVRRPRTPNQIVLYFSRGMFPANLNESFHHEILHQLQAFFPSER